MSDEDKFVVEYVLKILTAAAKKQLASFNTEIGTEGEKAAKQSSKAASLFNKAWDVAATGVKNSVSKVFSGITDQVIGFPKTILDIGTTFEASMAKVQAIGGGRRSCSDFRCREVCLS